MSTSSPEQRSVFRRKPVEAFVTETGSDAEGGELSRSIGLFQLTMFEVGATIGTGIFIILTEAVPEADPSIIISFVLAGITAALTAVCYAELASTIWGHPSLARVDAEYAAFLTRHAEDTIAEAREFIGDAARAEYISTSARTATEGLVSTATRTEADLVVLGSARHGPFGRFAVGSVTNEMLHTAPVPVVLTPRGYSPSSDARLRRVTCAFAGSTRSRTAFDAAVQLSRRHGLPL